MTRDRDRTVNGIAKYGELLAATKLPSRLKRTSLFQIYVSCSLLMSLVFLVGGVDYKHGLGALYVDGFPEGVYGKLSIANLVLSGLWIVCDSLLIHGIRKAKRKLMIPWLCIALAALIAGPIVAAALLVLVLALAPENAVFLVLVAVLFVLSYPVGIHFFLVVYSHFRELSPVRDRRASEDREAEVRLRALDDRKSFRPFETGAPRRTARRKSASAPWTIASEFRRPRFSLPSSLRIADLAGILLSNLRTRRPDLALKSLEVVLEVP
ncbi:unnamed protein product [Darwinula stevensoni]|uniref:Uncharacterized protein n=1 Tax=Darwinula stevensoni TaxID=69355 RepID=A0A7R9FRJ1_9CRUS|nr:unnamed protein product [Darwinula stevensoni]CAG0901089.1 unnamed protein product [Darwinula stevensoni]